MIRRQKLQPREPDRPPLRFAPTAWAKLLFLRDSGPTEVGGFGITPSADRLLVTDVQLVEQRCGPTNVAFDRHSVADYFDRQVDLGLRPDQFGRIWCHTHPDDCPLPSSTDENTFAREFGRADWAVMFILARGGQTYCRLRFNVGPGGEVEIPVTVANRRSSNHTEFSFSAETKATETPSPTSVRPNAAALKLPAIPMRSEPPPETSPPAVSTRRGPSVSTRTPVGICMSA